MEIITNKFLFRFSTYFVGGILLLASIGKLLDIKGFQQIIETYQMANKSLIPLLSYFFPLVEGIIGIALINNMQRTNAAIASILLHAAFVVVMTIELLRGIDIPNCGCFGVFFGRPLTWISPLEDVIMILFSFIIYFNSKRQ